MVQETEIKFINPQLKIGVADWRKVYLLSPFTVLNVEIHKGMLVYRARGSNKRFTYQQVKKRIDKKKDDHQGTPAFLRSIELPNDERNAMLRLLSAQAAQVFHRNCFSRLPHSFFTNPFTKLFHCNLAKPLIAPVAIAVLRALSIVVSAFVFGFSLRP
jgi:hypothetical protein